MSESQPPLDGDISKLRQYKVHDLPVPPEATRFEWPMPVVVDGGAAVVFVHMLLKDLNPLWTSEEARAWAEAAVEAATPIEPKQETWRDRPPLL